MRLDFAAPPADAAAMPDPTAPYRPDDDAGHGARPAETRLSRTRLGTAWTKALHNPSAMIIANTGTQSVLRLVSNIILARLLAPNAFALMAITTIIMTGLQMVSDVGIAITALREGEMSRENEDKLWTMQIVRGLGVGLLMAAAAVPVGWIYQDNRLRDVLFALALMPIFQGAQSLYPVLALGHRRLLPSTLLEVGGRVAGMILSIAVAFVSPTVWSLVVGTLAGILVSTIGSHLLAGRWPRFVVDLAYMSNQWRFSRWIQTSSTLTFVGAQVDRALFPFLFGMSALGVYGIASTFATMPGQVTQRWSASVFYPLAVQLLKGSQQSRRQLMAVRTTMLLYTSVVVLAMTAVAPIFFLLLYEPQYHAAARLAQILALGIFFDTAESSLRHFPLVEDTPRYEVWVVLVRLAAFALGVPIVYATGTGVPGYALAYVVGLAAGHVFMLTVCVRRNYLRPTVDFVLTPVLVGLAVLSYWMPVPAGKVGMLIWAAMVAVVAGGLLLLVYVRRGLPSLSVEPAPETLRETAEEELGTLPQRA